MKKTDTLGFDKIRRIPLIVMLIFFSQCRLNLKNESIPFLKFFMDLIITQKVVTPTFDPPAGTYNKDQLITINTSVSGTTIYYTTDGSKPTTASAQYTGAISLAGHGTTKTIQALAVKSGMVNSGISSGTYIINYEAVAMPTLNPPAGTYTSKKSVALSTTTEGASIFYTLDGTTPTVNSTLYTEPILIEAGGSTATIQAMAVKTGMANSSVVSGSYIMNFISAPTFSPLPDIYGSDQSIRIDSLTFGATIYYTLDGFPPNLSSSQYSMPISIAGNGTTKTIKAIAVKSGIPDSPIVTGTWTIDTTLAIVSINSVSPGATINGTTDPQINWQSNSGGTYIVKVGGTSCADGTTVSGTNVSGSVSAGIPIVTTVSVSGLANGANSIRICAQRRNAGNYGSITQSLTLFREAYSWGTFTDNFDGTIRFDGLSGTFGGNLYSSQTLTFKKCSQGQTWNPVTNNCDGTAGTYQYCSANDNSCNSTITWILDGSGISSAYSTCDNLVFAGHSDWRLPNRLELNTLIHCTDRTMPSSGSFCGTGNYVTPTVNFLFPATSTADYWTAEAFSSAASSAYIVRFFNGTPMLSGKIGNLNVRCVR